MKTTGKFVHVYDFDTKEVTTIPAAELAPGMVQATIQGMEGTYWINPTGWKSGPFRHPPFGSILREKIKKVRARLKEVRPLTYKEWEDGFRRDLHAEREINSFLLMSGTFMDRVKEHSLDAPQRKVLFRVLMTCMTASYEHVWQVLDHEGLPFEVARDSIEQYYGYPALKKEFAQLKLDDFADHNGNLPVPVTKLEEPEVREALKKSDLIFGMDCFTKNTVIFYGLDMLKRIVATAATKTLCTTSLLYDSRTDQLELLYLTVKELKGSCCYGASN